MDPNTPVLVGVGQVLNRIATLDDALEPLEMMMRAVERATEDTGTGGFLTQVQSVRVIRGVWNYENPAKVIAERIGAPNAQTVGTLFGGNQNQAIVNHTADAIQRGELDLVLITGAENGYSANKARKAGVELEVTAARGTPDLVIGAQKPEHHEFEVAKGIRQAIQVYPMYDNAIRHERGETVETHLERVSALWARFNDVAVENPNAWVREDLSAEQIRTASASNRQISFPYTKLMNANMMVDMGAALIMCSVAKAKALGIAEERWVYPWLGVQGYDHFSASVRHSFTRSPGIRITGQRAMELAGVGPDELDFVDLYSCFPSAVQVAARELGLSEERPLTVTGGLTFGGGPLNNYVMHSIARTVELLRERSGGKALVTANGGNLYKHVHGIYSSEPPMHSFRHENVQAEIDALPSRRVLEAHAGEVTIESYTVMFGADRPSVGHIACLTASGDRTWINTVDPDLMAAMTSEEFCGRSATITSTGDISIR